MKKIILLLLSLCCICSVFAQTDSLLKKYRNMALEYNHDLKAAEKNIRASIELEKNARADQLPKIGANANFQYTGNPAELSLSLPSAGKTVTFQGNDMQYGASVSLMQPVYTGKRILGTIRLAEHQQSLANNQAEVIRTLFVIRRICNTGIRSPAMKSSRYPKISKTPWPFLYVPYRNASKQDS